MWLLSAPSTSASFGWRCGLLADERHPCVAARLRGREWGQGMLQDQVNGQEGNLGRDQQLAPLQALWLAEGGEDGLETGI